MSIIFRNKDGNFERLDATPFENEDRLQAYITANPEAIPLHGLDENLQLLILKREVSTDSGRVDVLGIDQKGGIYLIETKLHSNPDKRNVVAQILDYGASLWRHCDDLDDLLRRFGSSDEFRQKIVDHFELESVAANELFDVLDTNLKNGIFQFIVLMDNIDPRLKDLILFINQNSQFSIYAVELKYYKKGSLEILAPDLHGAEIRKRNSNVSKKFQDSNPADFWSAVEANQAIAVTDMKRLVKTIESSVQENATFKYTTNPAGEQAAYIRTEEGKIPLLLYASGKLTLHCRSKSNTLYHRANRILLMKLSREQLFLSEKLKPEQPSFKKLDLTGGTAEEINKLITLYQQAIKKARVDDA